MVSFDFKENVNLIKVKTLSLTDIVSSNDFRVTELYIQDNCKAVSHGWAFSNKWMIKHY